MRANRHVWCAALLMLAACGTTPVDDDVASDTDDGNPEPCDAQLNQEACEAADQPGNQCEWVNVQTFGDVDACQVASTEGRCIGMEDQGNGCAWWSCDQTNYYARVGDAGTELFDLMPDSCGQEPSFEAGWRQCTWSSQGPVEQWSEGTVCDCACGSPPSGTEPS